MNFAFVLKTSLFGDIRIYSIFKDLDLAKIEQKIWNIIDDHCPHINPDHLKRIYINENNFGVSPVAVYDCDGEKFLIEKHTLEVE